MSNYKEQYPDHENSHRTQVKRLSGLVSWQEKEIFVKQSVSVRIALIVFASVACCGPFASPSSALAQSVFSFSSQAVGVPPQMLSVSVNIPPADTLNTIQVLTEGIPDLDFTKSIGGTCIAGNSYPAGICTVNVSFNPRYPGLRRGAVLLFDNSGQIIATQFLSGSGIGSLSVMAPGEINTVAGDGFLSGDGATATTSAINLPLGEATDAAGNLFFSDSGNNRIRKVDSEGNITTVAGTGTAGFLGDGGPAASAQIDNPAAIAIDGAGNIFFADSGNNAIREINGLTGIISTVAGALGQGGYLGDGLAAIAALLSSPKGLAFDADNNLYIADTGNNVIRKVNALKCQHKHHRRKQCRWFCRRRNSCHFRSVQCALGHRRLRRQ